MNIHTERTFQEIIQASLCGEGGYEGGDRTTFDAERGLFPLSIFRFIQATQPDTWDALQKAYGPKAETRILERIMETKAKDGTLHLLRQGFRDVTVGQVRLAYFRPNTGLNPDTQARYAANIMEVTDEVHHSPRKTEDRLDLVLSLNGIPVATAELKNAFTGQTVANAVKQYKFDRSPKDPILSFKSGALVHFAVDGSEVYMATRLAGKATFFLPFNRGRDGGAGNPDHPSGHRSAYLWEDVWAKDRWLDIIQRFLFIERKEEKDDKGKVQVKETMIFPRYHQLDVVSGLIVDARENGAGQNYLVQHSAGSGKSNSIAWLSHRLAGLHDADDKRIFDSVIVITDRRVLDAQLQETVFGIDHKSGLVERIDPAKGAKSTQLAKALNEGKQIVVCTLQSFSAVYGSEAHDVLDQSDKRFAVIVDEAHGSQHGTAAEDVRKVLGSEGKEPVEIIDGDVDPLILNAIRQKGKQPNLSFFAFTATPKKRTVETFGHYPPGAAEPQPFHIYSMRQAIEEGFIHDVLKGYTTYKAFYRLEKRIEDDPELEKAKAQKAIARFMSLHPHNLAQKTEVMVEHFRTHVRHRIGGRAKAMVVTSSRLHAVRYWQAFQKYIDAKGYDIGVLVAFSGTVPDPDVPGEEYTEPGLNQIKESELPEVFGHDDQHFLIVAEKYQTGFDQPLLHTMYVDKRLQDLAAVQTLSRLNRTNAGKEDTFVLDFVNEADDIKEAFKPYFETAEIDEPTDPNMIYRLHSDLVAFQYFWAQEVEAFAAAFYDPNRKRKDQGKLYAATDPAIDRFSNEPDEDRQEEFRKTLTQFLRLYAAITQMVRLQDLELEKLYTFGRLLRARLPKRDGGGGIQIDDDVGLEYYRLKKTSESDASLAPGEAVPLVGPSEVGTGISGDPETAHLSEILGLVNERFNFDFTDADKIAVDQWTADMMADASVVAQARSNTFENFSMANADVVMEKAFERNERNPEVLSKLMSNAEAWAMVQEAVLKAVYHSAQQRH
ncbi:type I restriction endonuclease [Alisedimentitalea sp. MJ-SS2]|uniref:type I restriction endonuclease subunit R n=1 Tax=Aliisedimentitalea sp. MJ-SS2 TaxID=3049795 RepID=UPI002909A067|nr:type I restriction endonuclease [Alisedimentitalea sp. MJ-SS2]MDU8928316.1 type I restriction endonuclease [Alisedimentitalea sp. MJ-SS2]